MKNLFIRLIPGFLFLLAVWPYIAFSDPRAHYLANEGVMIVEGETKVLFDPLFNNTYGRYELLPEEMKQKLFAGNAPYDGIDAVFISHSHGDHFSPPDMLRFLRLNSKVRLYAPAQAVDGMRESASPSDAEVFSRTTTIELEYGDDPVLFQMEDLVIFAVRIPHSGWPNAMLDVENIAFRVTLGRDTTVLHLGDADTNDAHFIKNANYWAERYINVAFPPYWYFSSISGQAVLKNRLKPAHAIGIHVPANMPDAPGERPNAYRSSDLFTRPGETRDIIVHTEGNSDQ